MEDLVKRDKKFRWYTIQLKDQNQSMTDFVFRGVTREELRASGTKPTTYDGELYILKQCVVNKIDWGAQLYYTVQRILEEIYKYSGLTEEALTLKEAHAWLTSPTGLIEGVACTMISGCSLESLHNADPSYYAYYCLLGKMMFETTYGMPVDQAFGMEGAEGGDVPTTDGDQEFINVKHQRADQNPFPGHGEQGKQVEVFEWKKPKKPRGK